METLPILKSEWKKIHPFNKKVANEFLCQSHFSPNTLTQYKSALKIFFQWVYDFKQNKPICELTIKDGMEYQNYIANKGLFPQSVRLKRSAVTSICGFFEVFYSDDFPNFKNIFNKYIPNVENEFKFKKEYITKDEMMILTNELRKQRKFEMLAFIWFTYVSGARRAEVAQLRKEVVTYKKPEGKNYYLTHEIRTKGKGKKGNVRQIPFDDVAMSYLKEWIKARCNDDCPFMFKFRSKNPNGDKFNRWCRKVFTPILEKRVHPHMFRRTRATHLVQDGASIEMAQRLLGHKDPNTTRVYVINNKDLLEDIF